MESVVQELHRPARRNFARRKFVIRELDEFWQADLIDMSAYAKDNNGYKFMLTVIDTFLKFAWAEAIKSKSANDVTNAMKTILQKGRVSKHLQCDMGNEFYNKMFKNLMSKYGINLYSTYSVMKASICERFNRTLKRKMWMLFTLKGSYKWVTVLPELVSDYNNTKHRTIKMKPIQVNVKNSKDIYRKIYNPIQVEKRFKKLKFKINDKVRISKYKHIFEKGYTPNFTTEIFTVYHINNTTPITYLLKDYENNPIKGCFYEVELTKAEHPEIFLVEKVIKKRGNKVLVKWLGFSDSHNSWIDKNEIKNL